MKRESQVSIRAPRPSGRLRAVCLAAMVTAASHAQAPATGLDCRASAGPSAAADGSSSAPGAVSTPSPSQAALVSTDALTDLLLSQPEPSEPQGEPGSDVMSHGVANGHGGEAGAGGCSISFDLESGNSGDANPNALGGSSGDAFGGQATGGDSSGIARSGDVVIGGNGGPGGFAGGSGPYAGAVIGDFSDGGGGDGGDGGRAMCIGGPTRRNGRSCSSGDINAILGNGGNALGGNAESGNGGDGGVKDSGSGDTGGTRAR